MDVYSAFREFADSWALLAMVAFFAGVVIFALTRSPAVHDDAARAIFRHDAPAGGCAGCDDCACPEAGGRAGKGAA